MNQPPTQNNSTNNQRNKVAALAQFHKRARFIKFARPHATPVYYTGARRTGENGWTFVRRPTFWPVRSGGGAAARRILCFWYRREQSHTTGGMDQCSGSGDEKEHRDLSSYGCPRVTPPPSVLHPKEQAHVVLN